MSLKVCNPPRSPSNAFIYNVRDTCAPLSAPDQSLSHKLLPTVIHRMFGIKVENLFVIWKFSRSIFLPLFFSSPLSFSWSEILCTFFFPLPLSLSLSVPPFIFFWLCISLFLFVSWSRIKKKVIDMQMDRGNSIFCLLWGRGDFYEVRIVVGL